MNRCTRVRPPEPILHVDMDAFYAAVETRRDPSLTGRPVLVGGTGGRGVVASASYEARAFGVHSAMPMSTALRRCPDAVVLPPDFAAYRQVAAELRAILDDFTPLVEPLALDEAFLDVGGSSRLYGAPAEIGAVIRSRVTAQLGLVASVGVAPNKFLAKLASTRAKPDGLLHIRRGDVNALLAALPVEALWGVGARTAEQLRRYGLRTAGEVAAAPASVLARILGAATAEHLQELARGDDRRPVVPDEPAKGLSAEETFARDVDDPAVLRRELLGLAERVARRLRAAGLAARTVTLKVRYASFQTVTRSRTLPAPAAEAAVLHEQGAALLDALRLERARVRLLGLGASNLAALDAAGQLCLLDDDRWSRLEQAADVARDRFGEAVVTRGALLEGGDEAGEHRDGPAR